MFNVSSAFTLGTFLNATIEKSKYLEHLSPDPLTVMSSASGLVGLGSHICTGTNPERGFKGPVGRCKATTHYFLSLASNRVSTNY